MHKLNPSLIRVYKLQPMQDLPQRPFLFLPDKALNISHMSYRYLILEGLTNRKCKRLIESLIMQDFIIEEVVV